MIEFGALNIVVSTLIQILEKTMSTTASAFNEREDEVDDDNDTDDYNPQAKLIKTLEVCSIL